VASFNELYHATNPLVEEQGYIACSDVVADKLVFQGECVDLDQFTNAFDTGGYVCSQYSTYMTSLFNGSDSDFPASSWCSAYDDSDWTASSMCCACGGGSTDVFTSASCAANLDDNCKNMDLAPFSLLVYLRGLFETLLETPGFEDAVTQIVKHPSNLIAIPADNKTALTNWVISGNMSQSILSGSWEMLPGVPHPRGLTGCDFLTSFEITALLNTNLCSAETYASIKSLCPVSCGCTQGTSYVDEGSGGTELYEALELSVRSFTQKTEDLVDCPASCVLPHPVYTGDTIFNSWEDSEYVDPEADYYYDG
jgi:hypothetical protein